MEAEELSLTDGHNMQNRMQVKKIGLREDDTIMNFAIAGCLCPAGTLSGLGGAKFLPLL